jgi:hypothetical protein
MPFSASVAERKKATTYDFLLGQIGLSRHQAGAKGWPPSPPIAAAPIWRALANSGCPPIDENHEGAAMIRGAKNKKLPPDRKARIRPAELATRPLGGRATGSTRLKFPTARWFGRF